MSTEQCVEEAEARAQGSVKGFISPMCQIATAKEVTERRNSSDNPLF